ncbi:hypothetical protein C8Q79DRAFT_929389 [Trametes meyenii]|nr:hypothetical protein C8Q79DRAFT_929389 [Trametes meyenii]
MTEETQSRTQGTCITLRAMTPRVRDPSNEYHANVMLLLVQLRTLSSSPRSKVLSEPAPTTGYILLYNQEESHYQDFSGDFANWSEHVQASIKVDYGSFTYLNFILDGLSCTEYVVPKVAATGQINMSIAQRSIELNEAERMREFHHGPPWGLQQQDLVRGGTAAVSMRGTRKLTGLDSDHVDWDSEWLALVVLRCPVVYNAKQIHTSEVSPDALPAAQTLRACNGVDGGICETRAPPNVAQCAACPACAQTVQVVVEPMAAQAEGLHASGGGTHNKFLKCNANYFIKEQPSTRDESERSPGSDEEKNGADEVPLAWHKHGTALGSENWCGLLHKCKTMETRPAPRKYIWSASKQKDETGGIAQGAYFNYLHLVTTTGGGP